MALTIESLKNLFKKLGGSDSGFAGVNTIPEAIDKVTSVASSGGGGGSLPEPGAVGNVMTSTGDGWESAAPSGGELAFALTVGESVTCDVPVADIVTALESNSPVFGTAAGLGELIIKTWSAELNKVVLLLYLPDTNKLTAVEFVGTSGTPDTWTYEPKEVNGLPSAPGTAGNVLTSTGNGWESAGPKYPLIVHGTWASGTPNTVTITTPLADIYEEAEAGRAVFLEYTEDGVTTRMGLVTRENDNGAYAFGFSVCTAMSDKPAVVTVAYDNSLVGVFGIAVGQ